MVSLVDVYKDNLTAHFMRLRTCALNNDSKLPPSLDVITLELRLALNQLAECTSQRFSHYIILDYERGLNGSLYRGEYGIDKLGKHNALA